MLESPFKHSISGFSNCACKAVCNTNKINQYQLTKGESPNTKKHRNLINKIQFLPRNKTQIKQSNLHAETLGVLNEGGNTKSHGGDRTRVNGLDVVHYVTVQVFLEVLLAHTQHYQVLCVILQIKCMELPTSNITTTIFKSMNSMFSFIKFVSYD